MNRAFWISSLFLILFLIFYRVQSAKDIIQDTCKKLADSGPSYNFGFCVNSLGLDSESHRADLEGLGLIGLRLLQANLTGTTKHIKHLLKQKSEKRLLKALSLCLDAYSSSEGIDMTPT
ncbi:putative invertase inhibitor [Rhodamnia argentea]|nr:putative invertase inhibitor [Rhodamnia argentea]